jgi:dephospho-CoA kinase
VSREFASLGCAVINADEIGHELLDDAGVIKELRQRWGESIFNVSGQVDRSILGGIVFGARKELDALNAILHPRIGQEMTRAVDKASSDDSVEAIVLDAALLIEAGWDSLCNCVIFIDTPSQERLRRVKQERCWTEENWSSREKMQISLDIKRDRCDYSLDGSSSVFSLRQQIRKLYPRITHPADGFEHRNRPE